LCQSNVGTGHLRKRFEHENPELHEIWNGKWGLPTLKISGRRQLYAFFGSGLSRPLNLDVGRQ
jgi:hypothetical protein